MVIRKMKIEDYDNVYDLWMSCKKKNTLSKN